MEKRSARGRTISPSKKILETPVPLPKTSPRKSKTSSQTPNSTPENCNNLSTSPTSGDEVEILLNARGMPARQRKKNRLYYDDDVMITPELSKSRALTRKSVKCEPIEVEEVEIEEEIFSSTTLNHEDIGGGEVDEVVIEEVGGVSLGEEEEEVSEVVVEEIVREVDLAATSSRSSKKQSNKVTTNAAGEIVVPKGRGRPRKVIGAEPDKSKVKYVRLVRENGGERRMSASGLKFHQDLQVADAYIEDPNAFLIDSDIISDSESGRYKKVNEIHIKTDYDMQMFGDYGLVDYPESEEVQVVHKVLDKKTAQEISIRIRNLLKLPKAHKWVCYEWFYSNIDKVLFDGENDFQICLKESFPELKIRKMCRVEWCKVRRLMGKPRRCSQSFFDEEREELSRRRYKIRLIQQRKVTDFNHKELPDEIPLQLSVGTKVTARLRKPQDGLFTGTVDGVDTSNNTYRITFDRPGLGTHSILDYEVLSNETPETVSTSSFALKIPRRPPYGSNYKFQNPLLVGEDIVGFPKSPFPVDGMLGGFPIRLLDMIVRLSKLLKSKREKILQLKELNVEAEKLRSYEKRVNEDFRIRYARVVVDLESMNNEMNIYLEGVQQYCLEVIAPDHGGNQMIIPDHLLETSRQESALLVDTYNIRQNRNIVQDDKMLQLVSNFISVMLQIKALAAGDRNLYELQSIKDTLLDIKASLEGRNLEIFQNRIEIPISRIEAGLTYATVK